MSTPMSAVVKTAYPICNIIISRYADVQIINHISLSLIIIPVIFTAQNGPAITENDQSFTHYPKNMDMP